MSGTDLQATLRNLHHSRNLRQKARPRRDRSRLNRADRAAILLKTDARCHICGGAIEAGEAWQADHVLARSAGGKRSIENYLPAHALCNNYRWDYSPEEFQLILKLGVWLRTQMERGTSIGLAAAAGFTGHERVRTARRKRRQ